jgi:CRP-like cAMP-binding protein
MHEAGETTFHAGDTLFKQGDPGGDLYFIKSGKVELVITDADTGKAVQVGTVEKDGILGAMSFLDGGARSATARATVETKAVIVHRQQLMKLLKTVPSWFQTLLKDLSANMHRLNAEFVRLKAENEKLRPQS